MGFRTSQKLQNNCFEASADRVAETLLGQLAAQHYWSSPQLPESHTHSTKSLTPSGIGWTIVTTPPDTEQIQVHKAFSNFQSSSVFQVKSVEIDRPTSLHGHVCTSAVILRWNSSTWTKRSWRKMSILFVFGVLTFDILFLKKIGPFVLNFILYSFFVRRGTVQNSTSRIHHSSFVTE